MSDDLKPCPGCGGENVRVIGGPGTKAGPKHWAGCDHCSWRTWGKTEALAVAAWNTRADSKRIAALEALLIQRDGGSHDPDCKAVRVNQRPCNCGHEQVEAYLTDTGESDA